LSVFIHPLRALSEYQVRAAIRQGYNAGVAFGSTFSSSDLVFPGNTKKKKKTEPKKLTEKG